MDPLDIRTVAVVGGGISGVCTAAHLLQQGLYVVLYERSSSLGGVWHFDPRQPLEPSYPNETPSKGDYEQISFFDGDDLPTPPKTPDMTKGSGENSRIDFLDFNEYLRLSHAPPGPCYVGLKNNVSLPAMRTSLGAWPAGLDEFVSQRYLEQYIQQIAKDHRVDDVVKFNTRVEEMRKVDGRWRILTSTLQEKHDNSRLTIINSQQDFDAVVVASGHYHMAKIPSIPGLSEWKRSFPSRIAHSKGYRDARIYQGRNVLIVGAGVSSFDIAKEIEMVGGHVYQSSRNGQFDLPASSLPQSALRVAGVARFLSTDDHQHLLPEDVPIPGKIELVDGSKLSQIDYVIIATGYITSYPFLRDRHADQVSVDQADMQTLITDGTMVHNLFKDIWYMEDPTLAFVGVPYHISTFSLFDFQAQAVARVFSGAAKLPDYASMRSDYNTTVALKGLGREYHSLRATGAEMEYVAGLVSLANASLRQGVVPMKGHTLEWLAAHKKQRRQLAERFGGKDEDWLPKALWD